MAWAESASVGSRGSTVLLVRRTPGGTLSLRHGTPHQWRALGHRDWERGLREAKQLSGLLLAGLESPELGRTSIRQLLAKYFAEISSTKNGPIPREEARRVAVWAAFLEPLKVTKPDQLTPEVMRQFAQARRAGTIFLQDERSTAPKNLLRPGSTDTTIGHDIAFLQFVLGWAHRRGFLRKNPLYQYRRPETARPKRPVATYDRYQAVLKVAPATDPSGRFAAFMACIEGLGWRRGAICRLHSTDLDRKARKGEAPYGRIRKRASTDKQRVEMWIPLPPEVRTALDTLPIPIGGGYLFPRPKDPLKPWRGEYARDLLERCEAAAGLEPLEGGDFHPYRRAWATARKGLPAPDVMAAGGWRDRKTMENCYQEADPQALLAVMVEPTKLRSAK